MKKFYILTILCALLGVNQAWATYSKIANSQFKGIDKQTVFSWNGDHATFTISTEKNMSYTGAAGTQHMSINGNGSISITPEEGCAVTITRFNFVFGNPHISSAEITINGEKRSMGGWSTNWGFDRTCSVSDDSQLLIYTGRNVDIYSIELWYTVTPKGKPTVVETAEASIDVTVDLENKQTIDLSQFFTRPEGLASHFAFGYDLSCGEVDGDNFYATAAGTYTVKARIAKTDCHEETELSEGEATIIVNRLNQTLSWVDEEVIETDIVIEDTKNIAAVSTSGRAVSYASSNESVLTVDETGILTTIAVGEAIITASCGQDDQYNAAEPIQKTFQVVRKAPEFLPVDFATEDSCAVRKEQTATIELNNVSDGLDGDFTAVASDDKISVSREGNVLTIQALNVGETTLTLSQKQTDLLAEFSKTYKIEVLRFPNAILVNGEAAYTGEVVVEGSLLIDFASENTDEAAPEFIVEQLSGEDIATFEEGAVVANYHVGTATWKVSQAASENFEAAEVTFSVTVKPTEEGTICYVLEDDELVEWGTVDRTKEYPVNGPAAQLKFQARRVAMAGFTNNSNFFAEYSTTEDTDDWTRLEPYMDLPEAGKDKWYTFTYDVPENTKRVRMRTQTGAVGYRSIQNVRVTRKTYLRAEDVVLNLLPEQDGKGVLTVNYSLADGDELTIKSDNDLFTLDQNTIAYGNCTSGKVEIPVHFAAQTELGTYTTNLTIYNGFYNASLKLVAKVRITPEITWNISELTFGDHQENAASVDPSVALKYEVIEGDAITIDGDVLVAANAGKATVKAYTEETESYNAAEKTLEITVNQAEIEIEDPEVVIELTEGDELTNDLLAALTQAWEKILGWLNGIFTWNTTQAEAEEGDVEYEVTFTPDDPNYASAPAKVRVSVAPKTPTATINLEDGKTTVKILRDGQVLIFRDGKVYNVSGARVR